MYFFDGKRLAKDDTAEPIGLSNGDEMLAALGESLCQVDPASCQMSLTLMRLIFKYGSKETHHDYGLLIRARTLERFHKGLIELSRSEQGPLLASWHRGSIRLLYAMVVYANE